MKYKPALCLALCLALAAACNPLPVEAPAAAEATITLAGDAGLRERLNLAEFVQMTATAEAERVVASQVAATRQAVDLQNAQAQQTHLAAQITATARAVAGYEAATAQAAQVTATAAAIDAQAQALGVRQTEIALGAAQVTATAAWYAVQAQGQAFEHERQRADLENALFGVMLLAVLVAFCAVLFILVAAFQRGLYGAIDRRQPQIIPEAGLVLVGGRVMQLPQRAAPLPEPPPLTIHRRDGSETIIPRARLDDYSAEQAQRAAWVMAARRFILLGAEPATDGAPVGYSQRRMQGAGLSRSAWDALKAPLAEAGLLVKDRAGAWALARDDTGAPVAARALVNGTDWQAVPFPPEPAPEVPESRAQHAQTRTNTHLHTQTRANTTPMTRLKVPKPFGSE